MCAECRQGACASSVAATSRLAPTGGCSGAPITTWSAWSASVANYDRSETDWRPPMADHEGLSPETEARVLAAVEANRVDRG